MRQMLAPSIDSLPGSRSRLRARPPEPVKELFGYMLRHMRRRISSGPNEGLLWSAASTGRGYGRGTFEPDRTETIAALIQEGDCFWDVGAHKGYVTLLAARRVGARGTVYSFEPSRGNLWFLRKHVEWNRMRNVRVVAAALSCVDGSARFGGGSSIALKLGGGRESVSVRTIRTLLESGECEPPTFLKIDVEGSEADVLTGAGECLRRPDLALIVSIHSAEQHQACVRILKEQGFRTLETEALSRAARCGWNGWMSPDGRGDPDLVAIGSARQVADGALPWLRE